MIGCGSFGDNDPDLCIIQDTKTGSVVGELVVSVEGHVCLLAGTSRLSGTVIRSKIKHIPLATSEFCQTVTDNFLFVVKSEVKKDGNLTLFFSKETGKSYFNGEEGRKAINT
jgi:hypothetical protein